MGEVVFERAITLQNSNLGGQLADLSAFRHQLPVAFGFNVGGSSLRVGRL